MRLVGGLWETCGRLVGDVCETCARRVRDLCARLGRDLGETCARRDLVCGTLVRASGRRHERVQIVEMVVETVVETVVLPNEERGLVAL